MTRRRAVSTRIYPDLRTFFHKSGRTQAWLAEQLGVSQGVVSQYVNGQTAPSLEVAVRIMDLTNVPVESLLPLERR